MSDLTLFHLLNEKISQVIDEMSEVESELQQIIAERSYRKFIYDYWYVYFIEPDSTNKIHAQYFGGNVEFTYNRPKFGLTNKPNKMICNRIKYEAKNAYQQDVKLKLVKVSVYTLNS